MDFIGSSFPKKPSPLHLVKESLEGMLNDRSVNSKEVAEKLEGINRATDNVEYALFEIAQKIPDEHLPAITAAFENILDKNKIDEIILVAERYR